MPNTAVCANTNRPRNRGSTAPSKHFAPSVQQRARPRFPTDHFGSHDANDERAAQVLVKQLVQPPQQATVQRTFDELLEES